MIRDCRDHGSNHKSQIANHKWLVSQLAEDLRREQPYEDAGSEGRERLHVDASDASLFHGHGCLRADQVTDQFAQPRLVADERDAAFACLVRQLTEDLLR